MSNFLDFLKTINLDIEVKTQSYVYYTAEDGKIHKISGSKIDEEGYEIFEILHTDVADIINGVKSSEHYRIAYDTSLKQLKLKELTYEDSFDVVGSKLYQIPVCRTIANDAGSNQVIFEDIYDGIEVYVWIKNTFYEKSSIVWHNGNVYKLVDDHTASESFNFSKAELFIEDVVLSNAKSSGTVLEYKTLFEPIYSGIHVDVWYDELLHLSGQHVWLHNTVYKIKKDQLPNTHFDIKNAEIILKNVLLYEDSNKYLTVANRLTPGDNVLKNNNLYLFLGEESKAKQFEKSLIFHTSKYQILNFDETTNSFNRISALDFNSSNLNNINPVADEIMVLNVDNLVNGQKVLIGKKLFLTQSTAHDNDNKSDVNIRQNNVKGVWEIHLGKQTIKNVRSILYTNDILYFSITTKHDPNVVYRTMEFPLKHLANGQNYVYPYKYDWEFNKEEVSIYTSKYFDSYIHEVFE